MVVPLHERLAHGLVVEYAPLAVELKEAGGKKVREVEGGRGGRVGRAVEGGRVTIPVRF